MRKTEPIEVFWRVQFVDNGDHGWHWLAVTPEGLSLGSIVPQATRAKALAQLREIMLDGKPCCLHALDVSCPEASRGVRQEGESSSKTPRLP